MRRLLCFVAILFLSVPFVSAGVLTVDTDTIDRWLRNDSLGATMNGYLLSNSSRSSIVANQSVDFVFATGRWEYANYTGARSVYREVFDNSLGRLETTFRTDLNHEYCMKDNASQNNLGQESRCQAANPQFTNALQNLSEWMNNSATSSGSVTLILSLLHSRYDDGDTTKPCGSSGLNCPPDSYSYRWSTIISMLKLSYCPLFCEGTSNRRLIMSQWNEPYNVQYWLDNLSTRIDNSSPGYSGNCTLATVEFNNFIEKDYAAMETARTREGYTWELATPSWPVRSSAQTFNDCGVDMQDTFNERFSPATNGSIPWDYYEVHPYSSAAPPTYNKFYALLQESKLYAQSYGYPKGIITEFAVNSAASGDNNSGSISPENATYLNNSYAAFAVAFAQDDFWEYANFYTFSVSGYCNDVAGTGEFEQCYWMWSQLQGKRGAYYAFEAINDCVEGGSAIYSSTNTSGIFGAMAKLRNGTYCVTTGYAKGTGTEAMSLDFDGTGLNVSSVIDMVTGEVITTSANGTASLGTYSPGTTRWFFVNGTESGSSSDQQYPLFYGGKPLIIGNLVLIR